MDGESVGRNSWRKMISSNFYFGLLHMSKIHFLRGE